MSFKLDTFLTQFSIHLVIPLIKLDIYSIPIGYESKSD